MLRPGTEPHELVLFTGSHGAGKDTLEGLFTASQPDAIRHVRFETRPCDKDEIPGKDYHFVTPALFESMARFGIFIDHVANPKSRGGVGNQRLRRDIRNHRFTSMTMNAEEGLSLRNKVNAANIADRTSLLFISPCPEEVMIEEPDLYLGALAARIIARNRASDGLVGRLKVAEDYRRLYLDNRDAFTYIANENGDPAGALARVLQAVIGPTAMQANNGNLTNLT